MILAPVVTKLEMMDYGLGCIKVIKFYYPKM